jgi:hypothetical protein
MQSTSDAYDILPIGDFETVPVTGDSNPANFPDVVKLNVTYDPERIRADYYTLPTIRGKDHFLKRIKHFTEPLKDTMEVFNELGFSMEKYVVYPVRKLGTNKIIDELGDYTKSFLENFPVELFRQQFALAREGFKTELHQDHSSYAVHGYRLFIPVDTAYIDIEDRTYKMPAGDCYFVNVGKQHAGKTDQSRILLMCQMANDRLIQNGTTITPL